MTRYQRARPTRPVPAHAAVASLQTDCRPGVATSIKDRLNPARFTIAYSHGREVLLRFAVLIALVVVALLATPLESRADTRVALVIGNSTYQNVSALPNPVNDANDISESLRRLGFDVKTLANANFDDMRRALIGFGQQARGAEFAVIFFAGHGMEIGGENWLIPVDAQMASDLDVASEAIGLPTLTRAVSNTTKLGLVILDACRSNPFLPKMQRTNLTRAVDRGFARVEPNDNVLVAYAARDGTTANDGAGRNSPFTSSLLKNIETPGLEVRFLFANVRDDVMAATKREQQPYIYGSLSKEQIYLNGAFVNEQAVATQKLPTPHSNSAKVASSSHNAVPRIVSISGQMAAVVNGTTKVRGALARTNNKQLPADSYKNVIKIDGDRVYAQDPNNDFSLECSANTSVARRYADVNGQHVEAKCSYKREGEFYNVEKVVTLWSENLDGNKTSNVTNYSSQFSISGSSCSSIGESFTMNRDIQSLKFSNTETHLQSSGVLSSEKCDVVRLNTAAR